MATGYSIKPALGTLKALGQIETISDNVKRGVRHAWFETGKDLMKEAVKQINSTKTGVKYASLPRRSSAPGESAANQSGALKKSLGWKVRGHDSLLFGYGVSGSAPSYAEFIELGTPRGKIAARPTLKNTIEATNRNTAVNLRVEINKRIQP